MRGADDFVCGEPVAAGLVMVSEVVNAAVVAGDLHCWIQGHPPHTLRGGRVRDHGADSPDRSENEEADQEEGVVREERSRRCGSHPGRWSLDVVGVGERRGCPAKGTWLLGPCSSVLDVFV